MIWYHGTPDVRSLREIGAFEPRTEARRLIKDPAALAEARAFAAEPGLSIVDSARRLDMLSVHFKDVQIPVPVFFSARRDTAASYAVDQRALDYQNAEPAVIIAEISADADVTINAGRETFRGLRWDRIETGLLASGYDPQTVKDALNTQLGRSSEGRIRVSDLGAALWLCGVGVVDVVNVIDTHTGVGKPDTVRMVFDPEMISIPAFARDLTPQV